MTPKPAAPHADPAERLLADLGVGLCVFGPGLRVLDWTGLDAVPLLPPRGWTGPLETVLRAAAPNDNERRLLRAACEAALAGDEPGRRRWRLRAPGPASPQWRLSPRCWSPAGGEPRAVLAFEPDNDADAVRRQFERLLDSTPDGLMIIDPARRVRIFNRACGDLLGQDPERVLASNCVCGEVTGCHLEDGASMSASHLCPAVGLFTGQEASSTTEMLCTNSSGEERWVETSYSPVRNTRGEVEFVVGILRDIHERKQLEARLRQSEKLASLGGLTAGIAHEVKNPLGIILSSVEIILDDSRPRDMQKEAASFIKDEVRRLDTRLREFLAFARPAPAQGEPTVLNSVVRKALAGFVEASPLIAVQADLEAPEAIVHIDPDQVHQALRNLLLNAAEELPGGGAMLVRTRTVDQGVELEVHDSGPGIPAHARGRIFDPFFTTRAQGTGLGLSIVYQIVEAHGGVVEAGDSADLGGARFVLRFPFPARRHGRP